LWEINQQGCNPEVCQEKSLIEKSPAILASSVEENDKRV
jgi:hypothetical protein